MPSPAKLRGTGFPASRRNAFRARPGVSIMECVILMVILGITIAAILTTMGWASRGYAFAKEDIDRRTLVFNWVQIFESRFPEVNADTACKDSTEYLGGSWNAGTKTATFKTAQIAVQNAVSADGTLTLRLRVSRPGGAAAPFTFDRRFNMFTSDTVSDDVLGKI